MNTHRRTRKRRSWPLLVLGLGLAFGGAATLTAATLAPESVETAWGTVRAVVVSAPEAITGELPAVRRGASGSAGLLDRCDGTFSEMLSYGSEGIPPVWAAHNNCGGDVLLPWTVGQHLLVDGKEYVVVDTRDVDKHTATPADLVGLQGEIAFQTCYYGEPRMKFVGAVPVPSS